MPDGNSFPSSAHDAAPDPVDVAVGARIRLRRKAVDISQGALGEALGVSFQQVQKYERGANRVSASMLSKIAIKLETPIAYFFGETEDSPQVDPELNALVVSRSGSELLRIAAALPPNRLDGLLKVAKALQGEA